MERARELLTKAPRLYERWKSECEASAIRWEWADFRRHSLEPRYFEIHKLTPGRLLEGEPRPPRSGTAGHAFDREGRLVVTRSLTEFPGRFYEDFVRYYDDRWELLRYDYSEEKKVQRADVYRIHHGRVAQTFTAAANGNHFIQTFRYDVDGKLTETECTGHNGPYGATHDFHDLEYDRDGNVARVWRRYPDGRRALDFERPSETETFLAVRESLLVATCQAVAKFLRKQRFESDAYALAVIWDGAGYQHLIPPTVKVGLVSERQRFIRENGHDEAVERFLWSPPEWGLEGDPVLPKNIARKAELANQDIWQNDRVAEAEAFFRQLAADLFALDLPIPKTDDFICYASNIDLDRGIEDVRSQAPKDVLKLLKKRRFV